MKCLYALFLSMLSGCYFTGSQHSFYKPDAAVVWQVEVEEVPSFLETNRYICKIDGNVVMEGFFPVFETKFVVSGMYQDKPVQMSGYRKHLDAGEKWSETFHQIRVFIDHNEVTVFTF